MRLDTAFSNSYVIASLVDSTTNGFDDSTGSLEPWSAGDDGIQHTGDDWALNNQTLTKIQEIMGSSGDDCLTGGAGRQTFAGLAGADSIVGGADWVSYCDDPVRDAEHGYGVIVNLSDSTVTYWDGLTTVAAGTAKDGWGDTDLLSNFRSIEGSEYADLLVGGDDTNAGLGNQLMGAGGNDALYGGDDTLDGEDGFDIVDYSSDTSEVLVNLSGSQVIFGADTVEGGSALDGSEGVDTFFDVEGVQGSAFNDTLVAGDSGSWINGNLGSDSIVGGAGEDTLSFMFHSGAVNVGDGTATFSGDTDTFSNIEVVQGSAFDDIIVTYGAFSMVEGMAGDDVLTLGVGTGDTVSYEHSPGDTESGDGVFVNLGDDTLEYGNTINEHSAWDGWGGSDALTGIENITGSALNDCLMGDGNSNELFGGAGDDALLGSGGGDSLDGGVGTDWVSYFNTSAVFVNLDSAAHGGKAAHTAVHDGYTDQLTSIESAEGSDNDDTIYGSSGANWLNGLAGDDSIEGLAGDDVLVGGADDDMLKGGDGMDMASHLLDTGHGVIVNLGAAAVTVTGAAAASIGVASGTAVASLRALDGEDGTDTLSGIEDAQGFMQNDYLVGGAGDNLLMGVEGEDTLLGGAGADTFYYSSLDSDDDLTDFVSGTDTFVFQAGLIGGIDDEYNGYMTTAELQQHVFTSLDAFEAGSGSEACLYQSGDSLIYDSDGYSGTGDTGSIVATGVNSLAVTDIQVMDGAHHVV